MSVSWVDSAFDSIKLEARSLARGGGEAIPALLALHAQADELKKFIDGLIEGANPRGKQS